MVDIYPHRFVRVRRLIVLSESKGVTISTYPRQITIGMLEVRRFLDGSTTHTQKLLHGGSNMPANPVSRQQNAPWSSNIDRETLTNRAVYIRDLPFDQ